MRNDREMLELAAKACGYNTKSKMNADRLTLDPPVAALWITKDGKLKHTGWNPLEDDGAALGLVIDLELLVHVMAETSDVTGPKIETCERHGSDRHAATRRAIVRAAAEIGSSIPV